jgi:hypothetical protein
MLTTIAAQDMELFLNNLTRQIERDQIQENLIDHPLTFCSTTFQAYSSAFWNFSRLHLNKKQKMCDAGTRRSSHGI